MERCNCVVIVSVQKERERAAAVGRRRRRSMQRVAACARMLVAGCVVCGSDRKRESQLTGDARKRAIHMIGMIRCR